MKFFATLLFFCVIFTAYGQSSMTVVHVHLSSDQPLQHFSFVNSDQSIAFNQMDCNPKMRLEFPTEQADFYDLIYVANNNTAQPYQKMLWLDKGGNIDIYAVIKNGQMLIEKVTGSPLYDKVVAYNRAYGNIDINDSQALKVFLKKELENFKTTTFSLSIAVSYLYYFQNDYDEAKWLKSYLESLPTSYHNHLLYKMVNNRLTAILKEKHLALGQYAFLDSNNNATQIPAFQPNEIIVLDFWFVHCAPCRKQHQTIKKDKENGVLHPNVRFIGISVDEDFNTWRNYVASHDFGWENYRINYNSDKKPIDKAMMVISFPTYILLDHQGTILTTFNSYKEIKRYLNE